MDHTMLSIRHSFFDHAAQVQARLRIADSFPLREDIHGHAETLIDLLFVVLLILGSGPINGIHSGAGL